MGTGGWRRAFCTAVRRDPEATEATRIDSPGEDSRRRSGPSPSPRSCAKLSFFSGGGAKAAASAASAPSTPRLTLAAGLRVRTPKSQTQPPQCETPASAPRSRSPALFNRKAFSTPSSPRSPGSRFALFKHLSRSRCRICSQSLKASQETPVFTAECSHAFHFPCIAAHARTHGGLACPVCSAAWRQAPFLSALHHQDEVAAAVEQGLLVGEGENRNPNRTSSSSGTRMAATKGRDRQLGENRVPRAAAPGKVYDDDEPLLLVSKPNQGGGVRFNPIPEAANENEHGDEEAETEDLEQEDEFHGLLATPRSRSPGYVDAGTPRRTRLRTDGVQVTVMQPAALVSEGRRHQNYVVKLKVRAPAIGSAPLLDPARGRAPIDLVTVLDVSQGMTGEKLQMLKRAMRLVISSLGSADRLSMVAFSAGAGAKRLLPLRRMSKQGQRAARHIVERLVVVGAVNAGGASVGDALRKATKVLEDRRERNPVATIMLLSDAGQQQHQQQHDHEKTRKENNHDDKCGSNHGDPKPLLSPRSTGGGNLRPHSLSTTTTAAATTRFAHLEIPVEDAGIGDGAEPSPKKQSQVPSEDAFIKCVGGLVSVVMQDVRLQLALPSGEIAAVYPCGGGGGCCEVALGQGSSVLRLGDLYAEEEREMLVELRVPASAAGSLNGHHRLSVRCNHRDPATHELAFGEEQILHLPPLLPHHPELEHPSSSAAALRLRNTFVSTRAVAESRRLAELADYGKAQHLLTSARALLLQSAPDAQGQDHHLVHSLDAELSELQRRRRCLSQHQLHQDQRQEEYLSPSVRRQRREAPVEGQGEPLTPTSAWRAAEQLAKVAIMRKSLNRVSDLHGFENARF